MPQTDVTLLGVVLTVEYTIDTPDHSVGYSGSLTIEQVFIGDTDVTELLDVHHDNIRELVLDKL